MPCQPSSAITDPWRVIEWFCCSRGSRDCWLCSWYMLILISMLKIESHWSTSIVLLDWQNYTTWCYKYCHLNRTFRTAVILSARKFYGLISFCFFSWMVLHILITYLIGSDSILIVMSYEASENSIYPQCLLWVPFVLNFDSLCKVYFFTSPQLSSDAMHDHQTMNLLSQWKLFNTRNPQSCSFTMQPWMAERDCNYKKGCCDSNFGAGSSCRRKTREISHPISQGRR